MRLVLAAFAVLCAGAFIACAGDSDDSADASPTSAGATATRPAASATPDDAQASPTSEQGEETPRSDSPIPATPTTGAPPPPPPTQPPPPPPPSATPPPAPNPVSLTVVASNLRFSPTTLTAPAGAPITATIDNRDEGTPHDLTFRDAGGATIAETEIFNGIGQRSVTFTPVGPGEYGYVCTVHPIQMKGRLIVQ